MTVSNNRKAWMLLEIEGLLKCYLTRIEAFLHPRKKHNTITHAPEDMLAQGCMTNAVDLFEKLLRVVRFATL